MVYNCNLTVWVRILLQGHTCFRRMYTMGVAWHVGLQAGIPGITAMGGYNGSIQNSVAMARTPGHPRYGSMSNTMMGVIVLAQSLHMAAEGRFILILLRPAQEDQWLLASPGSPHSPPYMSNTSPQVRRRSLWDTSACVCGHVVPSCPFLPPEIIFVSPSPSCLPSRHGCLPPLILCLRSLYPPA